MPATSDRKECYKGCMDRGCIVSQLLTYIFVTIWLHSYKSTLHTKLKAIVNLSVSGIFDRVGWQYLLGKSEVGQ